MARKLTFQHRSEDEEIKDAGLFLDFDELAAKGGMSSSDANIAKWYGIYKSRQPGNHMARIVIPGGVVTSAQAQNIAGIAERYGQGIVNITTRQALQFHWLKISNLPDMLRELHESGNTTKHGCGDVTRNVAACPLAETCQYRRFDVRPFSVKTSDVLGAARDLDNLPRKFKITFSGCGADCAQPHINCLGFTAVTHQGRDGFRAVIGGGMGWKPFVAEPLFGFVPKDKAVETARAVALLFREHGDRYNRAKSRLKFVVHRKGIEFCRETVLANLAAEGVSTEEFVAGAVSDDGPRFPARPLTENTPRGTDGLYTVRVIVPKGEMTFGQFSKLATISDLYADQRLYTTNRQNLEFHGVESADIVPLKNEIQTLGFHTEGSFGLTDIVTCVGTTYCPKAVSETRALYDAVMAVVSAEKYRDIHDAAIVNITGCPNSCSPYRIADIGFRGMRIREEEGSVEGYEILLGGSQQKFGQKLGDFKASDCPEIVSILLDAFVAVRRGEETLTDCVARVGFSHFSQAVFDEV